MKPALQISMFVLLCLRVSQPFANSVEALEVLPVGKAFALTVHRDTDKNIHASWKIADGYYLYRHGFEVESTDDVELGQLQIPAGTSVTDPHFGDVEVYYNQVEIVVSIKGESEKMRLGISFQGCAKDRFCYAPQTRWFEIQDTLVIPLNMDKVAE